MASNVPLISDKGEDNYQLELSRVREEIKSQFVEFIVCLRARESELLRELDIILASYLSYRSELERNNEKRIALETTKIFPQNQIPNSPIKSVHEDCMSRVETELKSIETPIEPKMVNFECDSNKTLTELSKLGRLVESVRNEVDYKCKKQPMLSVCKKGKGTERLNNPHGVTDDHKTGNIYVADQTNMCVKVFDSAGKYLFKFGEEKMSYPRGVAICGERILITQGSHCILNYQLNGEFISRIGRNGKGELEFNLPLGLTIDESNKDIYICDYSNNRIQIMSKDYSYKFQFGKDTLKHPQDVKLSKEFIFVLDESNPCLHVFNYNHILQKSVISRGTGMQVINPCCFFIDHSGNILISDRGSNSILIFSPQLELTHYISVSNFPMGVTVDNQGRLIVVSQSDNSCLQIY